MGTILSLIGIASKLLGLSEWFEDWMRSRQDQRVGQGQQAAADVKETAQVAQAEAEAVAQAPTTKAEIVDALNKGEF